MNISWIANFIKKTNFESNSVPIKRIFYIIIISNKYFQYFIDLNIIDFSKLLNSFACIEVGYHEDPHDCRIFYRCVDWGFGRPLRKFKFECAIGTVFSKYKGNICTFPSDSGRSECGGLDDGGIDIDTTTKKIITSTTAQLTTTTQVTTSIESSGKPSNDQGRNQCVQEGYFPDLNDCRKFYRCVDTGSENFIKYEFECGVGTVWDPDIEGCNHPWAVSRDDCKTGSNTGNDSAGQGNNTSDAITKPETSTTSISENTGTSIKLNIFYISY